MEESGFVGLSGIKVFLPPSMSNKLFPITGREQDFTKPS